MERRGDRHGSAREALTGEALREALTPKFVAAGSARRVLDYDPKKNWPWRLDRERKHHMLEYPEFLEIETDSQLPFGPGLAIVFGSIGFQEQTMTMRRLSLSVFLVLCALCMAQSAYYHPQLPERVALHFGPSGRPDSWSTKTAFITLSYAVTAFSLILFLGISYGMSKIPPSLINLPNKDYWLSEKRKQETIEFMFHYFLWFGSATVLLLLDVFHQSIQVHLGRADSLPHIQQSLGLYICFAIVWIIGLFIKFGRIKESQQDVASDRKRAR
ncbi:MAG: DUF1648 domain-containing protein [Syntrophobacter sp.]